MTIYSGDEDHGDEITSPDTERRTANGSMRMRLQRQADHSVRRAQGQAGEAQAREVAAIDDDVEATGQGRLNTAGRSTKGSLPASRARDIPETGGPSRAMAEATKPGRIARYRLHTCARCADHYGPGGEER